MVQSNSWEWLLEGFKFELETSVKRSTVDYYINHTKLFVRWATTENLIGNPSLITKRDILAFLHWLSSSVSIISAGNGATRHIQRSDRSVWPYYRSLKRFFAWAVAEGFVEANPMNNISIKPPPNSPIEPYRPEHIQKMLSVLDYDWQIACTDRQKMLAARDKAVLLLFIESGLRLSELTNLRLDDIDIKRQRISVIHGKMDKSRIAGFGMQTKKALWRYIGLRPKETESNALWLSEEGQALTQHGIQQIIRRLKKDAGLQHLKGLIHKLRHTFATSYLRHTRDMKGCRLLLGHKTLSMTERYTEFIEAEDALKAYEIKGPLDWLFNSD